ncbi:MAG: hypothetical protein PHF63_14080 [Herbinix sp.]|nr:hypothetical protein [Herbinix sp.]
MKKKYFSVIFLILVFLAVTLSSDQSVKVMKRMFFTNNMDSKEDQIVIVIDPGHPRT